MNSLGQRLIFYLRHNDEMDRLYWVPLIKGTEPAFSELEGDPAELAHMVRAVGDAASSEAALFLRDWGEAVTPHLAQIGGFRRVGRQRPYKDWESKYCIWSKNGAPGWFDVGLYISVSGDAIGWIWCHRDAEESVTQIFRRVYDGPLWRSSELKEDAGTVVFARVRLVPDSQDEMDRDRTPLVAQAAAPVLALTEREIDSLVALSGN
jgi:hypothetical protein